MKYIKEHKEWQEDRELAAFLQHCSNILGLDELPNLHFSDDHSEAAELKAMGYFNPASGEIWILRGDRVRADWYRTLAHELVHWAQLLRGERLDGGDGSPHENEANSLAGKIMREWGRENPAIYG